MCLHVSYKEKCVKRYIFAPLKLLKKGSDPDPLVRGADPDPHQNVTDPHH